MFPIWMMFASMVPVLPLVWPHVGLFAACVATLLLFCTLALWLERERPTAVHIGTLDGEMHVAA